MKPVTNAELQSALAEAEFSYEMSRDMYLANRTAPELRKGARNDLVKVLAIKRWINDRKVPTYRRKSASVK